VRRQAAHEDGGVAGLGRLVAQVVGHARREFQQCKTSSLPRLGVGLTDPGAPAPNHVVERSRATSRLRKPIQRTGSTMLATSGRRSAAGKEAVPAWPVKGLTLVVAEPSSNGLGAAITPTSPLTPTPRSYVNGIPAHRRRQRPWRWTVCAAIHLRGDELRTPRLQPRKHHLYLRRTYTHQR